MLRVALYLLCCSVAVVAMQPRLYISVSCLFCCLHLCPCASLCVPVYRSSSCAACVCRRWADDALSSHLRGLGEEGCSSSVLRCVCIGVRDSRAPCLFISDTLCWRIAAGLGASVVSCVFARCVRVRSLTSVCPHCMSTTVCPTTVCPHCVPTTARSHCMSPLCVPPVCSHYCISRLFMYCMFPLFVAS